MSEKMIFDNFQNSIYVTANTVFDVSNSILKMSPSQKASIIEGIKQNIDIGKYNTKAENMISNSLVSSNTGLLYGDDEGKIVSLDNVFEYDTSSNTLNIMSSNVFDVSNSILKMSPSQKASIIEGIQKDIDFGGYTLTADSIDIKSIVIETITLRDENLQLLTLDCSENEILKRIGGSWQCAPDSRRRL